MARGLAPVGSRSGPGFASAADSNGGKPPRHTSLAPTRATHQPLETSPTGNFSLLRQCGKEFQ
ncbi:hypothetical protein C1Y11_18710 [Pseudomonas sp. FW305-20]|nr:hypothetical protein C1Y11_18710 [Pseudomonas sp. FW305-20]PMU16894.1 hypothetical protein C1Y10_17665 [Pseudomonas sp. FW305-122]PMU37954.1 hypothetical protein C1Y12_18150 [Pseudomonas sp. FW305-47B]PMX58921.1 hypothetical protein C1Y13_18965 [Pseudomonas sp. FW305-33]PMX67698.1 hypothetical protein C1X12_13615 [Pseudomonas sp. FW305-60]